MFNVKRYSICQRRDKRANRLGAAAVEFAVVAPLIFMLMLMSLVIKYVI